ncbi:MAG TPA: YDG domain-containing protein, partial [Gemmataceae bacterium]|nr:YDG domain-containing protein [Gemmataceae bacterium]
MAASGGGATFSGLSISKTGTSYQLHATSLGLVAADSSAFNVTARTLTVTATGVNKVYDGTATATVTLSDDRLAGDVFTVSYVSASFADKNVGTAKPITVTGISISGPDAGNYTLAATTASTTADITARSLTVTATGVNKVYDGTTTATVTLADNRVAGDVFTDSYTSASFADPNVGTAKPVSVSGINSNGSTSVEIVGGAGVGGV